MRSILWIVTSLLVAVSPAANANSELDTLRARCSEQERQIRQLEDEVSKLRSLTGEKPASAIAPAKPPTESPTPSGIPSSTYVVKAGDHLVKIARNVGTTPEKLAKANGLKTSSIIQPGQKLKVPGTAVAAVAAATAPSAPTVAPESSTPRTHKIKANETYSSISRKYKINVNTLIAANPKIKPTSLREGQVINLDRQVTSPPKPASDPVPAPTPTPTPAPPVAKAPATPVATPPSEVPMPKVAPPEVAPASTEAPTQAPSVEKKVRPIVIEQEITYGAFASKHGTDTDRLNALNGLDLTSATVLAKGSELYVPGQ